MSMPFALLSRTDTPVITEVQEFSYSSQRQVNVTPAGVPFVAASNFFGPSMTHNSSGLSKDDD